MHAFSHACILKAGVMSVNLTYRQTVSLSLLALCTAEVPGPSLTSQPPPSPQLPHAISTRGALASPPRLALATVLASLMFRISSEPMRRRLLGLALLGAPGCSLSELGCRRAR